jgi:hypothetical protein
MGYLERPFTQRYGEFRRDYGRPAQQTMDRAGFDDLVSVHGQGQEAPLAELPDAPFEPQPGEDDGGLASPLEFELKLADGKPARGAAFSVASDVGVIRTGKLDDAGRASLTDLEPGSYTVSFPDLDTESVSREV